MKCAGLLSLAAFFCSACGGSSGYFDLTVDVPRLAVCQKYCSPASPDEALVGCYRAEYVKTNAESEPYHRGRQSTVCHYGPPS